MNFIPLTLALVGLASAGLWEIVPLSEEAVTTFNPATFNVHNCSQHLYNVTQLPDSNWVPPPSDLANVNLAGETFQDCDRAGSLKIHDDYCLRRNDKTQCNVAYYVPVTPVGVRRSSFAVQRIN